MSQPVPPPTTAQTPPPATNPRTTANDCPEWVNTMAKCGAVALVVIAATAAFFFLYLPTALMITAVVLLTVGGFYSCCSSRQNAHQHISYYPQGTEPAPLPFWRRPFFSSWNRPATVVHAPAYTTSPNIRPGISRHDHYHGQPPGSHTRLGGDIGNPQHGRGFSPNTSIGGGHHTSIDGGHHTSIGGGHHLGRGYSSNTEVGGGHRR
ncbi:MAG TPA: hypothetical protein VGJ00_00990 [Rhabdochlamydiaceae bacterium]|jgi:hypothetical protein